MNATTESPSIQIIFKGLLAVSLDTARPAAGGRRPFCEVGVLDGAPGHETRISIMRYDGDIPQIEKNYDRTNIRPFVSLAVRGAVKPGIRTAEEEGLPEKEHLKWAVDLEGPEVYGRKVRVNPRGFYTVFHLNNGTFHTARMSDDKLEIYENGELKGRDPPRRENQPRRRGRGRVRQRHGQVRLLARREVSAGGRQQPPRRLAAGR
jgi:hypothetical protein